MQLKEGVVENTASETATNQGSERTEVKEHMNILVIPEGDAGKKGKFVFRSGRKASLVQLTKGERRLGVEFTMADKLKVLMSAYGLSQSMLAEALGVTYQTVSIKMNEHKEFTRREIAVLIKVLELTAEEVMWIFFPESFVEDDGAGKQAGEAEQARQG